MANLMRYLKSECATGPFMVSALSSVNINHESLN